MSSGGKGGRGNRPRHGGDKHNSNSHKDTNDIKAETLTTEKHKDSVPHKIAPTAEQLRLAQMIDNTKNEPDKVLQEKLNQVVQITGVSHDDALVALHDSSNDINVAINNLLEGDMQGGQWLASTKKKKKTTANKAVESDNNKENRKADNRERSNSRPRGGGGPRFRGRGGNRGGRDDGDGPNRGDSSKRGRMANGGPVSRGRGGRGRGSGSGTRTFQNRQPPGFPESIDTWGPTDPQDQPNNSSLKIDTWDDEPVAPSEEWDDEWTGSLEQTTVFGPSGAPSVDDHIPEQMMVPSSLPQQSYSSQAPNSTMTQPSHLEIVALLQKAAPNSTLTGVGQFSNNTGVGHLGNVGNLVNSGVGSLGNNNSVGSSVRGGVGGPLGPSTGVGAGLGNSGGVGLGSSNSVGGSLGGSAMGPLGNGTGVGTLGGIGSSNGIVLSSNPLGGTASNNQHSILSSLSNSMGEVLKTGGMSNSVGSSVSTSGNAPYSQQTPPIQNSIFSNPGLHSVSSSLNNSINSSNTNTNVMNKPVTMPGPQSSVSLASRQKVQRSRIPHSKIPQSAVEMPEDAMNALDIQFSGLEFGESFDLNAVNPDIKATQPNNVVLQQSSVSVATTTPSMAHVRDVPSHSVNSTVAPMQQSLAQPSKLGPDPISYPSSQTSERKPTPSAFSSSANQRGGSTAPQGLMDLSKKDSGAAAGLASLMGGTGPPFLLDNVSKTSTTFPSPPSASNVPPPSHQMSSYSSSQTGGNSGYSSSSATGSNSNNNSANSAQNPASNVYGTSFSTQVSSVSATNQYQNNYVNSSSHSSLASMSTPKTLSGLKDSSQNYNESSTGQGLSNSLATSATGSNVSGGSSSVANSGLHSAPHHTQPSTKNLSVKTVNVNNSLGSNMQSSVQSHQTHMQATHQQQLLAQPSQYMSPPAALQGGLPPAFYNVQTPLYSLDEGLLLPRMPPMQAPTTLTTGREGNIPSAVYTVADNKFRTDQNSSPVPSSINQQGAAAGGTYITAPGNAGIPPYFMYHNVAAVPNSYPQFGTPAIIQFPPNTHTGSNTTQFAGAPKLPYGSNNYYEGVSQAPDFKSGYASVSQGQSKAGGSSSGSASNSTTDLPYKNHLSKSYEKQSFHTATPPPYNLAGSGTNPMTANAYPQMFIPTMPTAQHHSPLMHHQLHQDGGSSAGQRSASSTVQNKSSKGYPSYWAQN